ncbi:hypothetical protein [Streptomyces sp. NPDC056721]|uniref:hypothetical protein n=1 Tax=unclassified Streptomyces TaxID=2593676 RepID=UPI0036A82B87
MATLKRLPESVTTTWSARPDSIFLRLSGSVLGSSSGRGDPGRCLITRVAAFPELDGKSAAEAAFFLGIVTDEVRPYGLSGTDRSPSLQGGIVR